jgi:Domain of unknown function (DUF4157)
MEAYAYQDKRSRESMTPERHGRADTGAPNPLWSALSLSPETRSSGPTSDRSDYFRGGEYAFAVDGGWIASKLDAGAALDSGLRAEMESRLGTDGADLSSVRVHADHDAGQLAQMLGADALTVGSHIAMGKNQFDPDTTRGRTLLVHELAHTVQQQSASSDVPRGPIPVTRPTADSERDADAVAKSALPRARPSVRVPAGVVQRQGSTEGAQPLAEPGALAVGSGKALNIEFHAFIPGSLGRRFDSFPHAKDLKNQASFDADVAAVTSPNSWKPEPMKTEDDVKDPGSARKVWFYSTDERTFGGGNHRVGFKGTVASSDIGSLSGKGPIFHHWCDDSHRVRTTDTGIFTSSGETGSVDGPHAKAAPVTGVKEDRTDSSASSTVETKGAAAYAFMPTASPDIDYDAKFQFDRKATGGVDVSLWIEHNLFPFYEVIVNGTTIWNYSSKDTGPTLINLNRSTKYFVGPWPF